VAGGTRARLRRVILLVDLLGSYSISFLSSFLWLLLLSFIIVEPSFSHSR
jgi:hypothetical protein